jgi:hypothetical protein
MKSAGSSAVVFPGRKSAQVLSILSAMSGSGISGGDPGDQIIPHHIIRGIYRKLFHPERSIPVILAELLEETQDMFVSLSQVRSLSP